MNCYHFVFYCYNIFPDSDGTEPPFFLMFGCEPAKGCLTNLNNSSRYYRDSKGKIILAELHKLWKHHAAYLKEVLNRKDNYSPFKPKRNTKFKIGKAEMVKSHTHQTFEPKYLMDLRVLKIINERKLLL